MKNSITVKELKDKCREKGLKVSGTKKELIERLSKPTSDDFTTRTPSITRVSLGWGDPNSKKMSILVEKGFATFVCYATDNFVYDVNKEKWAEILSQ